MAESQVSLLRRGPNGSENGPNPETYLSQWRIGKSPDTAFILRVLLEESTFAVIIGLLACLTEFMSESFIKANQGSGWLILFPLLLFLSVLFLRPFAEPLYNWLGYPGDTKNEAVHTSTRFYRIFLNFILIGVILILGFASPLNWYRTSASAEGSAHQELDVWKNLEPGTLQYIMYWFILARKFQGSCVTVMVYRMYAELAILSFVLIFQSGDEANKPTKVSSEQQQFVKERAGYYNPWDVNDNLADLNANPIPAGASLTRNRSNGPHSLARRQFQGNDTDSTF